MTARTNHAGTVGGIALLGCALMIVFVLASQALTQYGPLVRAALLDTPPWLLLSGGVVWVLTIAATVWAMASIDP